MSEEDSGAPYCAVDWTHGVKCTDANNGVETSITVLRNTTGDWGIDIRTVWEEGKPPAVTRLAFTDFGFNLLLNTLCLAQTSIDDYPIKGK